MQSIISPTSVEGRVAFGDTRLPARIWAKTQTNDETGCWEWTGKTSDRGYGYVQIGRSSRRAHRVAYEALVGNIPDGLALDHLCRVRNCINPAHLEPVTAAENTRRAAINVGRKGMKLKPRTHCPQGHPFDAANTYLRPNNGRRMCRTCMRIRKQRNQQAKRVAVKGGVR